MQEQVADNALKAEMDANGLYTEEVVTDRKVGTIRILTPITTAGARDGARETIFLGEAQVMTQMGPLPISFEIPAKNVAEAVEKYGESANEGLRQTIEKIQQMRREEASKIVTPGTPGFQTPPEGMGGIQMP